MNNPLFHANTNEAMGYAYVAFRNQHIEEALAIARAVYAHDHKLSPGSLRLLAALEKKAGSYDATIVLLEQALGAKTMRANVRSHIHLSLAKLYEHKKKDFKNAIKHARHTALAEKQSGQERRINRLKMRMQKQ